MSGLSGASDPLVLADVLVRLVQTGATLFAVGTLLGLAGGLVERPGWSVWLRRTSRAGWLILGAAAARFGLTLVRMGDLAVAGLLLEMQGPALGTLAAGAGLAIALPALQDRRLPSAPLTLACSLAALLLAAASGLSGHARALPDPGAAPLVVSAHLLLAAMWVSAVWLLWPSREVVDGHMRQRIVRFGTLALLAVPALAVAGLWLALVIGGGWDRLSGSGYGAMIAVKAAAVLVAMLVGAHNRLRLVTTLDSDPVRGRRLLRQVLVVDAGLFLVALVAVVLATTLFGPA